MKRTERVDLKMYNSMHYYPAYVRRRLALPNRQAAPLDLSLCVHAYFTLL